MYFRYKWSRLSTVPLGLDDQDYLSLDINDHDCLPLDIDELNYLPLSLDDQDYLPLGLDELFSWHGDNQRRGTTV